jgi:membrane protein YqaA with SNARE-associated domain
MYSLFHFPGYPLLFLLSFWAATLLPIGSEWMLVLMIIKGFNPEYCVLVASAGNYLGACTTYLIGWWGSDYVPRKILRMDDRQIQRATRYYARYGSWSLLFSWVPIIGDPLCLVAGTFRMNFFRFSVLVFFGKLARYALVATIGIYS